MFKNNGVKGLRSFFVFIPTILLIGILYILIIVSTVFIDKYTISIADETKAANEISDTLDNLQSHSSKLSATASSFAYSPTIMGPPGVGVINSPLIEAYLEEFTISDKKPSKIRERISAFNIEESIKKEIFDAINAVEKMIKDHAHSFLLIHNTSYIDIPDNQLAYFVNAGPTITNEELALSDDEKLEKALDLLFRPDYSNNQRLVSENISKSYTKLNESHLNIQNEYNMNLKYARGFLWGSISLIIIANIIFFFILFKKLILPITRFAKRIEFNESLETEHSLYEANYLALAYNSLLYRHKEYEEQLRNVAEYDSLTGLPNRYCYNEFLRTAKANNNSSCIFLFDINNLKYVNDTYGHSKGDDLIKKASLCIKECFLIKEGKNCYRIGGDEFVAILDYIEKDDIKEYIDKFIEMQKQLDVSIAYGYSYANDVSTIGYEKLIIKADKEMYKMKKLMHEESEKNNEQK